MDTSVNFMSILKFILIVVGYEKQCVISSIIWLYIELDSFVRNACRTIKRPITSSYVFVVNQLNWALEDVYCKLMNPAIPIALRNGMSINDFIIMILYKNISPRRIFDSQLDVGKDQHGRRLRGLMFRSWLTLDLYELFLDIAAHNQHLWSAFHLRRIVFLMNIQRTKNFLLRC